MSFAILRTIKKVHEPTEKDKKDYHCLTAVMHNFKSDIHLYKVPKNTNSKMSLKLYINKILEPIFKSYLQTHQDFALQEDIDSEHGPRKSNILRKSKKPNGSKSYFNCHNSPDQVSIGYYWQSVKQTLSNYSYWKYSTYVKVEITIS